MTLPAGTIAQPTAQTTRTVVDVQDTPTATVTTYSDGSTEITYKNQPIVDAECRNMTTGDINNGLVCQYNIGVPGKADYFEQRYIPTERWTKQVRTFGQLKADIDRMYELNPKYGQSGAWSAIYFNNPSWHPLLSGASPTGSSWAWELTNRNYDIFTGKYADDFKPDYIGVTGTSGGNTVAIRDPSTGTLIDTTNVSDPNAPIPGAGGKTITEIVYPNGQPPTSPISPSNPIPPTGTSGGGTPVAGPLGTTPGDLPILPPRTANTTMNVSDIVTTAAATQPAASPAKWLLWVLGAAALWLVFGG